MQPKYQHDCDKCKFLGRYLDHDVYLCVNANDLLGGSVIARYGDGGPNYVSYPISVLLHSIQDNSGVEIHDIGNLPYHDFIFSDFGDRGTKAIVLALSQLVLRQIKMGWIPPLD